MSNKEQRDEALKNKKIISINNEAQKKN